MARSDFGEFAEDGSIKRDVTHSILSKRETQAGDVLVRVAGTNFFYRVQATEYRQLLEGTTQADIEAQVAPLQTAALASAEGSDYPRLGDAGEIQKPRRTTALEKKE